MPLTNPNKVVTEERLSEFYGQILPYMGGMPDVLANKFSKGDLYSTDEKMIGCWVDNKPLYQKVIESGLTNFTTSFRKYGTIGVSNISVKSLEYIVVDGNENNYYGQNTAADDEESYAYIEGSTGDFYFKLDKNWTSAVHQIIAIVKYTKTTDSPIAIGSDTDYSTDEKIVGTWIDGKPIYQKTVVGGFNNLPISWANTILASAFCDNIETLLGCQLCTTSDGYNCFVGAQVRLVGTYLQMYCNGQGNNIIVSGTLKYTKTTD